MSLTLVNDCVLIPTPPDWASAVKWRRQWATGIAGAVTGAEDRAALRTTPFQRLEFRLLMGTPAGQALLEARVLAALKSGRAAVPHWGRPSELAGDAASLSATVTGLWPWKPGDWALFSGGSSEAFETRLLAAGTEPGSLVWGEALVDDYPAGRNIYPLLFGRLSVSDMTALTNHLAEAATITLQEPLGD